MRRSTEAQDSEPQPAAPRQCARVGCAEPAEHTLTADYDDRVMAVGPLSPTRTPPAHDLCDRHASVLTPPTGWQLLRYDPERARPSNPQ